MPDFKCADCLLDILLVLSTLKVRLCDSLLLECLHANLSYEYSSISIKLHLRGWP